MNEQRLEQHSEEVLSLTVDVSDEDLEAAGADKTLEGLPSVFPQSLPLKC